MCMKMKELQSALLNTQEELTSAQHKNKSLELLLEESVSKQVTEQLSRRHQVCMCMYACAYVCMSVFVCVSSITVNSCLSKVIKSISSMKLYNCPDCCEDLPYIPEDKSTKSVAGVK